MLSSESDLFQEQSIYDASPKDSQEFLNKTSNQFLSNSSFHSQQSTVIQSMNDVEIRPKRIIKKNSKSISSSLNFYSSPQEFAKSNNNKTVIFSRKSLQKQPYINCNQSFSNFSNILSNSMTIESDTNSDIADENCKKNSLNNTGLQDDNEECGYENQLEKKFISPRTLTKYNVHGISNEQNQRFSSISPTKYSNHSNLLKTLCNPKIKNRRRLISSSVNQSLQEQNNMSLNQKLNTQPVASMSNYLFSINTISSEKSNKVIIKKPKIRSQSVYVNTFDNEPVQIQQSQNQNQNDKTNLNKLQNLHSSSCMDQKQINVQVLKRQIEGLLDRENLQRVKTEYRGISPSNPPSFITINPRSANSPLKRRPLLQSMKVQSKQHYETEARNLIQYYGNNAVTAYPKVLNSAVNTQLRKGSIVRPAKQFTDSLFSLSNQITQTEKSMLSSYYKEFIRITPA